MADSTPSNYTAMTNDGLALLTQLANAENRIKSFRAVASDTVHWGEDPDVTGALTTIDSVKQDGVIQDTSTESGNKMTIQVDFDQGEIESSYQLNTVGLFATDENAKEVLYAVECLQHPQYMDVSTTSDMNTHYITIAVGNAEQVDVSLTAAGSVSKEELTNKLGNYVLDADLAQKIIADMPANVAQTDKANVFTEQQTLAGGAVNKDGKPYITNDDVEIPDGIVSLGEDGVTTTARDKTGSFYGTVNVTAGQDLNEILYGLALTQGVGRINVNYGATNMQISHSITGTYEANGARCFVNAHDNGSTTTVGDTWFISAYAEGDTKGVIWKKMVYADTLPDMTQYTLTTDVTKLIADAKQQAIDQIQPLIDAEMTKRNVPSYFWSGDATAYAAVTPKVADADYSVFE